MANDSKAHPETETFVAEPSEIPDGTIPGPDHRRNPMRSRLIVQARKLSRSTQFVIAAALILGLTMFFVGELVMHELKRLDKIAYIRFASVYKNFEDLAEFQDAIAEVGHDRKPRK
mgnify:CR=1 FL=1